MARTALLTKISIPNPGRSRTWLANAIVECDRCHKFVDRTSPIQRYCSERCRPIKRARTGRGPTANGPAREPLSCGDVIAWWMAAAQATMAL
jgi:hypothetical protein